MGEPPDGIPQLNTPLISGSQPRDRPTGIQLVTELRKTVASVRVITHSCDSSHSFPPFAQVTSRLVNG
jgi:hypothetical protein